MFAFQKIASVQGEFTSSIPTQSKKISTLTPSDFSLNSQMLSSHSSSLQINTKTLVIIDSAVENTEYLLQGIIPNASTIVLNFHQDGVEQITQALQYFPSISSLHIISHGSPGSLQLGKSYLSLDTLEKYKKQLQTWSIKHLLLYGCHVAVGDAGTEFIDKLHYLIGAEIAASANPTGSKALGGDWDLAVKTSEFNVELAVTPEVQESYSLVLGTPVDIFNISESENESQVLIFKDNDNENGQEFTFGTGETLVVQSFEIEGQEFYYSGFFEDFKLQRSDARKKQLVWFDVDVDALIAEDGNEIDEQGDIKTDNANIFEPQFPESPFPDEGIQIDGQQATVTDPDEIMRGVLSGLSINSGTDNVFTNEGDNNSNNIERVDYFSEVGKELRNENTSDSGILILERSRNSQGDRFQIAAITAVDNGQPSAFGKLHQVNTGDWGGTGVNVEPLIMPLNADNPDNQVRLDTSQYIPNPQEVLGVYVSLEDLGLASTDEFYGYSLFANDVAKDNQGDPIENPDLTDVTNTDIYPRTTNNSNGGLDLIEGGFLYTSSDNSDGTDTSLRLDLDGDNSTTENRNFEDFDTETGFVTQFTGSPISIGDVDVDITDEDLINNYTVYITLDDTLDNPRRETESLSVSEANLPEGIEILFDYNPTIGSIVLEGSASVEDFETAIRQVVYNDTASDPDRDSQRVEVEILDGFFGFSNTAETIIEFAEPSENSNPVAVNDTETTSVDTPVAVNVLVNDTDPERDPLTITTVTTPANGTATINDNGTPANPSDDVVDYTPNTGFTG
ncbi:MAG: DUF4347 domain-containing protein, partial [Microcoleaceae cyanobacterium]